MNTLQNNFIIIFIVVKSIILISTEHLCFANQSSNDIRVYKYKHFFNEWDLPYEKSNNNTWRIKFNIIPADSNKKDWKDITNENEPTIRCFRLNCPNKDESFRTEPILYYFKNKSCEKIIVKAGSNESRELFGPILSSNNSYFQVRAYNIRDDSINRIQIFVDDNSNTEKIINIIRDRHIKPNIYKIDNRMNLNDYHLPFLDINNILFVSKEPLEIQSPSFWSSCFTKEYLKKIVNGITVNELETISKPNLQKAISDNNIDALQTDRKLKDSPTTFRYCFIMKKGFITEKRKDDFYININHLFQQYDLPPAKIKLTCNFQKVPDPPPLETGKRPCHILFLPREVSKNSKGKIMQLLNNISFDVQNLYEDSIFYQYDGEKTKFYECTTKGYCEERSLTWKEIEDISNIPIQYTIKVQDKIKKTIEKIKGTKNQSTTKLFKEKKNFPVQYTIKVQDKIKKTIENVKETTNESTTRHLYEFHDICESLIDFDNIKLERKINIVLVLNIKGLSNNDDKNPFDLIASEANNYLNIWMINLAESSRKFYTYNNTHTKVFSHDYHQKISKIQKRFTIGQELDKSQKTFLKALIYNLFTLNKMNEEDYVLSFVLPSIIKWEIKPSLSIICKDKGVTLKTFDLKKDEHFSIIENLNDDSNNKETRCLIPKENILKISLQKLSKNQIFFESINKTFKYTTKPSITFQTTFDFNNKDNSFSIEHQKMMTDYQVFNGFKIEIDLSNTGCRYWLNRPEFYQKYLCILLGILISFHIIIWKIFGKFAPEITGNEKNEENGLIKSKILKIYHKQHYILDILPYYLNYKLKIIEINTEGEVRKKEKCYDFWTRKSIESIEDKGYKISWVRSKNNEKAKSVINRKIQLSLKKLIKNNSYLKLIIESICFYLKKPFFGQELNNFWRVICKMMIIFTTLALISGWARSYFQNDIAGIVIILLALFSYFVVRITFQIRLNKINPSAFLQFNIFEQLFIALLGNMIWYLGLILYTN